MMRRLWFWTGDDQSFEQVTALGVAGELIEAGAGRRKQHHVATLAELADRVQGRGKVVALVDKRAGTGLLYGGGKARSFLADEQGTARTLASGDSRYPRH